MLVDSDETSSLDQTPKEAPVRGTSCITGERRTPVAEHPLRRNRIGIPHKISDVLGAGRLTCLINESWLTRRGSTGKMEVDGPESEERCRSKWDSIAISGRVHNDMHVFPILIE